MSYRATLRLCVYLPSRSEGQIGAARKCLKWLEETYPDGTVLGVEASADSGEGENGLCSLSELPLKAALHGPWLDKTTGLVERDSHIALAVHVDQPGGRDEHERYERVRLIAESIEEVLYLHYTEHALASGHDNVYQKLLFVEVWDAGHVYRPGRHDLTSWVQERVIERSNC